MPKNANTTLYTIMIKNTLQHLKLGKLKFGIRKIGCLMSWTRYWSRKLVLCIFFWLTLNLEKYSNKILINVTFAYKKMVFHSVRIFAQFSFFFLKNYRNLLKFTVWSEPIWIKVKEDSTFTPSFRPKFT